MYLSTLLLPIIYYKLCMTLYDIMIFFEQRTVHNIIEGDEGHLLWVDEGLNELLTGEGDGGDVNTQEDPLLVSDPGTSTSVRTTTRTVRLPPGMMVKKEEVSLA